MRLTLTVLLALTVLCGCSPNAGKLASFSEKYSVLHHNQDIPGLLQLIDYEEAQLGAIRRALNEETRWPLESLSFEPISKEESERLGENLSVEPRWRFFVTLDTEDRFTSEWLIGVTPEGIKILLPRSTRAEPAQSIL